MPELLGIQDQASVGDEIAAQLAHAYLGDIEQRVGSVKVLSIPGFRSLFIGPLVILESGCGNALKGGQVLHANPGGGRKFIEKGLIDKQHFRGLGEGKDE